MKEARALYYDRDKNGNLVSFVKIITGKTLKDIRLTARNIAKQENCRLASVTVGDRE